MVACSSSWFRSLTGGELGSDESQGEGREGPQGRRREPAVGTGDDEQCEDDHHQQPPPQPTTVAAAAAAASTTINTMIHDSWWWWWFMMIHDGEGHYEQSPSTNDHEKTCWFQWNTSGLQSFSSNSVPGWEGRLRDRGWKPGWLGPVASGLECHWGLEAAWSSRKSWLLRNCFPGELHSLRSLPKGSGSIQMRHGQLIFDKRTRQVSDSWKIQISSKISASLSDPLCFLHITI